MKKPKTTDDKKLKLVTSKPDEDKDDEKEFSRDNELLGNTELEGKCRAIAEDVSNGFRSQWERGNDQLDYWDLYDCELSSKQMYAGNSRIFVPIIQEAVNARKTRFTNQLFPRSGRNVDVISSDPHPWDMLSLVEHYVRKTKLRTQIVPALMKNGDIEGQYNVYVSWENTEREVVVKKPKEVEVEGEAVELPEEDDFDLVEETTYHMAPTVEVIPDADVLVLPHTASSIESAIQSGGCVAIIRRWSKGKIEQLIDDDEIDEEQGEELLKQMADTKNEPGAPDAQKSHVDAAGITLIEGSKVALVHEVWAMLRLKGADGKKKRRLARFYFAGGKAERLLSIKRNPYWNDKCPLLSAPVEKVSGAFKGVSKLKAAADLQYAANDTVNEAMDSAAYALMPIVMTDPSKNPRVGSMVLNLAAIWQTNPKDTQFASFPQLWKDGLTIVGSLKTEVFQLLSVSPAAIAQSTGQAKAKRNQAEIANEQQVDILSTADVCTNLEDEILTPLLRWFVELDYQYRDRPLTVRQFGQMGIRAEMQEISPIQMGRRYEFRWFGVEAARSAQMTQIRVAAMNMIRGIPPDQYQGYQFNAVPIITQLVEDAFGVRIAPEIFKDIKSQFTIDPEMENELLMEGLAIPVHVLDDDKQHMQVHMQALQKGDPTGSVREHLMNHRMQMQKKMQAQQAQLAGMQRGQPGVPGGGGQPGVPGTPRQGATPAGPRPGGQAPPGAVHQDQLQDASAAPRR